MKTKHTRIYNQSISSAGPPKGNILRTCVPFILLVF